MAIAAVRRQRARSSIAAAIACLIVALASPAHAQAVGASAAEIVQPAFHDGLKVWVTTTDGTEQRGTLLSLTASRLVLRTASSDIVIPLGDVQRVERPDPLNNGMRNGAIVGLLVSVPGFISVLAQPGPHGTGLAFVSLGTIGDVCIGTAVGAWIDHLIVDRRPVYSAGTPASRAPAIAVAPIVSAKRLGVGASIRW